MPDEIYLWIAGQLIMAAAIWGGIRIDIKNIHKNIEKLDSVVGEAHSRIDRLYERNHN